MLFLLDIYLKACPHSFLISILGVSVRCWIQCSKQGSEREEEGSWASGAPRRWAPFCPLWPWVVGFGWKEHLSQAQLPGRKSREWPTGAQPFLPVSRTCPPRDSPSPGPSSLPLSHPYGCLWSSSAWLSRAVHTASPAASPAGTSHPADSLFYFRASHVPWLLL